MKMKPFSLQPIFVALSLTLFILSAGNTSFAQDSSKIETKAGKLTANRSSDSLFQVKLDNKVLFESEVEYGSIKAAFPKRKPTIIVLSIGEWGLACAASFYVVDVFLCRGRFKKPADDNRRLWKLQPGSENHFSKSNLNR
ncbi:MAG: hypothetical protein H0X49_00855 [Acidobacteria bacterium]|nr:hypothetical protein [Acidobacteriota bacterium]